PSFFTGTTMSHLSFRRFNGLLAALIASFALVACGSNVRLDQPPVENRDGTAAGGGAAGGQGSGVDQRGVAGVQVPATSGTQPAAMQRVIYFDYDSFEVKAES